MREEVRDDTQTPCSSGENREEQKKKRLKKRVVITITLVVVGFIAANMAATEVIIFFLFGRSDPVLDQPFDILDWAGEETYTAASFAFMSGDNELKGYYILPEDPAALILLVHGMGGSSDDLEPLVQFFVENSYAVMAFDGTASGRSEGSRTVGLQQQRYDIQAALDVIRNDSAVASLDLVLFGYSAGAYGAAVEAEQSGAVAAVCVSGYESPLAMMRFRAEQYVGPLTNIAYPFLWVREYMVKGDDADESGSEALSNSGVPSMVIHGTDDGTVPMDISIYQAVSEKTAGNVRQVLVTAPGFSGHADILISDTGLNYDLLDDILLFLDPLVAQR